ncbi:MAG: AAA family ATPase, partial [Anaerolineales bacterium]|nr:AAA family ATPase [Anaerolineales bacterium]
QKAIEIESHAQPLPVYVVKREKARPFYMSIRGIGGIQTRIVGRNEELEMLQDVLQTVIDGGMTQVVTVLGEAGVGKSRLLYEFEHLLALQPESINILRGRAQRQIGQRPYSLFRDLLGNHFDIHRRNSPAVAREKLVRGIGDVMTEDAAQSRESAHFIGQLLGFDFSFSPYLQGILDDARRLRESAFQEMVSFMSAVSGQYAAAVLLLEDLHRADEGSLDLLDYLVERCTNVPLLIICLARPSLLDRRASWEVIESLNERTYHRIQLPSLNGIDSRHLAMDILQQVRQLPPRLLELIVNRARGNPFFTEELVSLLIEFGVIVPTENRWQIEMINLPEMPLTPTLADMVRLRLHKLPPLERSVLQNAAVSGRMFWDALLIDMMRKTDASLSEDDIFDALYRLEKTDWIYRRKLSTFADVQEYAFRHDSLSTAIYKTIAPDLLQQAHALAAAWLIARNGRQAQNHAAIIAYHFEQAQDLHNASDWYQQAALFAQNAYMPETAITNYQQALQLLPDTKEYAAQRIEINAGLGDMLQKQARFEAAVSAFSEMRVAALRIQNHQAERQAYRAMM